MSDIVLAVDNDETRARRQAEHLASLEWDRSALTVRVIHVFGENREGANITQFAPAREAVEVLEEAGIEYVLDETSGDPAERITQYVERHAADAVSVAGRKRSPAGKAFFGSVSQAVMLDSDVPVIFCPYEE